MAGNSFPTAAANRPRFHHEKSRWRLPITLKHKSLVNSTADHANRGRCAKTRLKADESIMGPSVGGCCCSCFGSGHDLVEDDATKWLPSNLEADSSMIIGSFLGALHVQVSALTSCVGVGRPKAEVILMALGLFWRGRQLCGAETRDAPTKVLAGDTEGRLVDNCSLIVTMTSGLSKLKSHLVYNEG